MWDSVWEGVFSRQAWGRYPGEDLIRFVARNFYSHAQRADVRILEVGCGPGANLWFLAREGFAFAGIDGSAAAITQAQQRLDAEVPGWRDRGSLDVGDIVNLPFPSGHFDAVIDNECVYCNDFESSVRIYNEMARVTKSGGKLFARTFAAGSWVDGEGELIGRNYWRCSAGPLARKRVLAFHAPLRRR
jgi:SAM-dependent methyltransferase